MKKELTQKQLEAKRKVASARRKKVYVYDAEYNFIASYSSTVETAEQMSLSQGTLVLALKGYIKTYKGLIFSYLENLTPEMHQALLEEASEKRERFKQQQQSASYAYFVRNHERCSKAALDCYYRKNYGMSRREYIEKIYEKRKNEGLQYVRKNTSNHKLL